MKIHVTTTRPRLFWATSTFSEKDLLKTAGFRYHGGDRCRPGCDACGAQLGKVWWTDDAVAAAKLADYADSAARSALGISSHGVELGCKPLALAAVSALAREKITPPLSLAHLRARTHEGSDVSGRIARVLADHPITSDQLAKLRELHWPESPKFEASGRPETTLREAIHPLWDGEDEQFDLSSLAGLEHCASLEVCRLGLLEAKNIGVLGKLVRLRRLALESRGKAPNLTPLAKLLALKELSISWAHDISALAGLPKLEKLELTYAKVADLSPLATLPALKSVRLWWSQPGDALRDVEKRNERVVKQLKARGVKLKIEWPEFETPPARTKPVRTKPTRLKVKAKAKATRPKAKAKAPAKRGTKR